MALNGSFDGSHAFRSDPTGHLAGPQEHRDIASRWRLGTGTLACPVCDAPLAPGPGPLTPSDALDCPFCRHTAAVRDFLSLATPSRPARVEVRVVRRARDTVR